MLAKTYHKIAVGKPMTMPYNVVIDLVTPTPSAFT